MHTQTNPDWKRELVRLAERLGYRDLLLDLPDMTEAEQRQTLAMLRNRDREGPA